jgi:hypothetical protein
MITAKPHVSLEAAVRYADALQAYNEYAIRAMREIRRVGPGLGFTGQKQIAEALTEYRNAHRNSDASAAEARSKVLELAESHGIVVDTSSVFYNTLYYFSFHCGVLARAEAEALAERNK